jgi:hypothetical protein
MPHALCHLHAARLATSNPSVAASKSTGPGIVSLPYLLIAKGKTRATKALPLAPSLVAALEENKDVKVRVEGAAKDLAAAGTVLKATMAEGDSERAAQVALAVSKEVESKERALATARVALLKTRSALADAEEGERKALFAARHEPATGIPNRTTLPTPWASRQTWQGHCDEAVPQANRRAVPR